MVEWDVEGYLSSTYTNVLKYASRIVTIEKPVTDMKKIVSRTFHESIEGES